MKTYWALLFLCCWGNAIGKAEQPVPAGGNSHRKLIIVTLDGFRWQELFGGADTQIMVRAAAAAPKNSGRFLRPASGDRRKALLPFLWEVVSREGMLLGNRTRGSRMDVANPYALSYAGYNEMFTGTPDLRIWNNDPNDNPNYTILEHLNSLPVFRGTIASFGSWGVFSHIFNRRRSRIILDCGISGHRQGSRAVRSDVETFKAAARYLQRHRPRVLHLGFGGTDEAGHAGHYAAYLEQAHLADSLIASIWLQVQRMDDYRGQTTLIITTDHGRGGSHRNWSRHGFFVPGSSHTWMALLGNGVKPLGELQSGRFSLGQLAGTVGYLMDGGSFGKRCLPLNFFEEPTQSWVAALWLRRVDFKR